MKRTGKGQGISINGGTSHINHYKQQLAATPPAPVPVFKPLVFKPLAQWPAVPHARQDEIEAFKAVPSRYA